MEAAARSHGRGAAPRRRHRATSVCSRRWAEVPREEFVPEELREQAYDDGALPIGHGQTISQPWVVAAICSALELRGDERVLEVGGGAGYSTAVIAELVQARRAASARTSWCRSWPPSRKRTLGRLGYAGADVVAGDGAVATGEQVGCDRRPRRGARGARAARLVAPPGRAPGGPDRQPGAPTSCACSGAWTTARATRSSSSGPRSPSAGSCRSSANPAFPRRSDRLREP